MDDNSKNKVMGWIKSYQPEITVYQAKLNELEYKLDINIIPIDSEYIPETRKIAMQNEFTAIIEKDGDWFVSYCPEIPGANGQGRTKEECLKSLSEAVELILEDRREDGLRGVPEDALRETVKVG